MQEAERYRVAQIKSQTSNLLKRTGWLLAGATRARPAAQTATLWRSRAAMSVSRTTAAGTRQRHRTASKRRMRKRPFVFMRQCRLNPIFAKTGSRQTSETLNAEDVAAGSQPTVSVSVSVTVALAIALAITLAGSCWADRALRDHSCRG